MVEWEAMSAQSIDNEFVASMAAYPAPLLEITFDQLRTLLVVHDTGSALDAARVLNREQSSVQKQLDTLNRGFQRVCGELLVLKQGRGQRFLFTPAGLAIVGRARALLSDWHNEVSTIRRNIGQSLAVGTTEFCLDFLGRAWGRVADEFESNETELKIVHVRTKDAFSRLNSKEIDLLCAGLATPAGETTLPGAYDFLEWKREGLVLLTNLSKRELPPASVGAARLPAVPLIIPARGIIADFLGRWYGQSFHSRLNIVATIDDVYYGLALLRSRMAYGCMLVTQSIGDAILDGTLPGSPEFRLVGLAEDFDPVLELIAGVFTRKGDREQFAASHPLNMLWNAFNMETTSEPRVLSEENPCASLRPI